MQWSGRCSSPHCLLAAAHGPGRPGGQTEGSVECAARTRQGGAREGGPGRGICSPHRAQDGDLQMLGGPALRAAGGLSNGCGSEVSGKAGRAPRARKPLTPLGSGPWSLLYSRVDGPRGSSPQTDSRSCRPHGPRPAPRASLLAFRLVFLGFPREFLQSRVVPRAEVRGPEPPGPGSRPQLPTCFGEAECLGRAAP